MMKSSELRTEPCETPLTTSNQLENVPRISTRMDLDAKNDWNYINIFPCIP